MTIANHMTILALALAVAGIGAQPAASAGAAEVSGERIFGLSPQELSDTVLCAGESIEAIRLHFVYDSGKPFEETLPMLLSVKGDDEDPALIEARLRAIYDAKPASAAAWVEPGFKACLKQEAVPLDIERAGDCYLATYFLASQMLIYRERAGRDPAAFAAPIQAEVSDPKVRGLLPKLVSAYAARGALDPKRQNMQDTGDFLRCTVPGEPPVSGG